MTANQQNPTFEDLRYDPFLSNSSVLVDNLTDPDENFFNNNNFKSINTPYFLPDEARNFIHTFEKNSFSAQSQYHLVSAKPPAKQCTLKKVRLKFLYHYDTNESAEIYYFNYSIYIWGHSHSTYAPRRGGGVAKKRMFAYEGGGVFF